MRECFLVFSEPGSRFHGVHLTVDGAAHNAAALGAELVSEGNQITIDAIRDAMRLVSSYRFDCPMAENFSSIRIERHAVLV